MDGSKMKCLLVEDNEINAEIAGLQLRDIGLDVEWVSDGARAVAEFDSSDEGQYAVILMDIMMPVMDGIEAADKIRHLNRSDATTVPIIAMTANAFSDNEEAYRRVNIAGCITKPYGKRQLQEVVLEVLGRQDEGI